MTPLSLALLFSLAADPVPKPPAAETAKPVGVTRDAEKDLLEQYKTAKPRLPLPQSWALPHCHPADPRLPPAAAGWAPASTALAAAALGLQTVMAA